jgi:hypothetical protein
MPVSGTSIKVNRMGIWIGFIIGQWLHIALRVQNMLRSPKNECDTIGEIAHVYGLEIAARVLFAAAGLGLWNYKAEAFAQLVSQVGLPSLPLIFWTALGYGLVIDELLESAAERWPVLRRIWKPNGRLEGANGRS